MVEKTIGIVPVAAHAATAAGVVRAAMNGDLALNQSGCQGGQSIVLTLGPTVFDRHIPAHNNLGLAQTFEECA
jgi:hypothetical protein